MSTENLPQWYYDLTDTSKAVPVGTPGIPAPSTFQSEKVGKKSNVAQPRGKADRSNDDLKLKKAWELALAPAKSLPMNLFVSYMSGNALQIVPIMMTLMMFFINPVKQIFSMNSQFDKFQTKGNANDVMLTKIAFFFCQLLALGAGIWKLGQMGLLPNTKSDWLAWEKITVVKERSL
ncbi:ER membrane protein complex subunit 4 [Trichomonascus vanleenenianus]|uniref:chaperone EMC4 n=1 Tax=Trichomonascus vanleenenianus TaxID=2268995 RepID=UPI003EC98400